MIKRITDEPFGKLEVKGYNDDCIALVRTVIRNPENLVKVILLNPRERKELKAIL